MGSVYATSRVFVQQDRDTLVIRSPRKRKAIGALLLAAAVWMGVQVFLELVWNYHFAALCSSCFFLPFGALLAYLGIVSFLGGAIRLDGQTGTIRLPRSLQDRFGPKCSFRDVRAVLLLPPRDPLTAGRIALSLAGDEELPIVRRLEEEPLQDDAARLADLLNVDIDDRRLELLHLPTEESPGIAVLTSPLGKCGALKTPARDLIPSEPDLLRIVPKQGEIARKLTAGIGAALVLFGGLLLAARFLGYLHAFWWTGVLFGVFFLLGGLFLLKHARNCGLSKIELDRGSREVRVLPDKVDSDAPESVPLTAVVGVQIVPLAPIEPEAAENSDEDEPMQSNSAAEPAPSCQVNLILSDPPGKRILLLCHAQHPQLEEQAQQIAAFLHIPVVDHRLVQASSAVTTMAPKEKEESADVF